jgi:DNA repair protein RAD5
MVRSGCFFNGPFLARIGLRPIRSNALLLANKTNGQVEITNSTLSQFDTGNRLPPHLDPRSRSTSPAKRKRKAGEDEEEEEVDSGDEAELLNEEQLGELDTIYQR